MPTIANFTNDHSFPTFAACPIENDASSGFFQDIGPWINPTRHWAAFFEVTASDVPLELKAIDKSGQQVKVFYTLSVAKAFRTTFPVGHTLAVLYPARSQFMTGTEWLGLGDELRVMIIPLSMVELLALNERVQQQSSVVDGKYACHGCGARKLKKELYVCFRCELAWYCDEVSGFRDAFGVQKLMGSRIVS
ncbi:hypothetical protein MMC30_002634 [Trapelia coarctata]|nr:hypothetical protein [Trapelia coarctata]